MIHSESIDWSIIRAVTFDVGGTLIKPRPSVGHVYAEVAARHGVTGVVPEALTQGFIEAWKSRADFNYSQAEWFEIVRQSFGGLAPRLPEAFFPEVYSRFSDRDVWHVFEDVPLVLAPLASRDFRLGIISNWDERLRPLLQVLDLHDWFEAVAVSHEVGRTKPALAMFDEAVSQLGLAPEQVLHIGDSYREDVLGAQAAGLAALQIDRATGVDLCGLLAPLLGAEPGDKQA